MLTRVADALFWIGRYMERAENHTRLINTVYHLNNRQLKRTDLRHWQHLISLIGNEQDFLDIYQDSNENNVLHYVTLSEDNQNSIRSCIHIARNNMRQLREKIPSECWDQLNSLYLWLNEQTVNDILAETPYIFYKRIQEQLSAFQGILYSTMLRGKEWNFIETGKFLERADNGLRILQAIHYDLIITKPKSEYQSMMTLIKATNGYESYRQVYSDRISMQSVVEFMLLHPAFPRSTCHALSKLEFHLQSLLNGQTNPHIMHNKVLSYVGKLRAEVMCTEKTQFSTAMLGAHLDTFIDGCNEIGLMIDRHFFHEAVVSA